MAPPDSGTAQLRCSCGNVLTVSRQFVGRQVTCYACGKTFTVAARPGGAGPAGPPGGSPAASAPAVPPVPTQAPATRPPAVQPAPAVVAPTPQAQAVQVPYPVQVIVTPPGQPAVTTMRHVSPVPSDEQTIWEGRSALAYHVPGMIWAILWIGVWLVLAALGGGIASALLKEAGRQGDVAKNPVVEIVKPAYITGFFLLLAAWALWRLGRRMLVYLNTYYIFTTQRLRFRRGIVAREMSQMELFRVKDFSVIEPLWGRLTGYAHVRIVSSDRVVSDVWLRAVPGGLKTMDKMRLAAQLARSETGITTIGE
jgi:hypothetical protein